ncbi:hypothetical protein ACP70R_006848 [Stipagrostis hirtigluma subsp. patula]
MESSAAGAGASAASTADDPYFPIYISSDEEDEQVYFDSSYSSEQIQMQEAIILSLDYSRAPLIGPSSSLPSGVATAEETPPDRKGKRKLSSEDGPGGSKKKKRSKRSHFSCAICLERVQDSEKFLVSQCAHAFCKNCVGRYVAAKIAENVVLIGCPDPECEEGFVEMHLCQDIVPPELFDRWNIALCEDVVGDKKFYCPFKDCSALLIHDDAVKIRETECPHCHRLFCARCRVPWHDGIKCKEFRKLGDDEKGEDDLTLKKLADKKKWKRCPRCKMYVSRRSGCLLIKCSVSTVLLLPLRCTNDKG